MAKAEKTTITKKKKNDEVLRDTLNDEWQRRLLALEPDIHAAIALAETLSFIAEVPNAPISGNTMAFLIYGLDERIQKIQRCWRRVRGEPVENSEMSVAQAT